MYTYVVDDRVRGKGKTNATTLCRELIQCRLGRKNRTNEVNGKTHTMYISVNIQTERSH